MSFLKRIRKGFTLIEMLVVVVTIGILTVALIPRIQSVQVRARNVARIADLSQVYKALKIYALNNEGFPDYATGLEGGYISSLPRDVAGISACLRYMGGGRGGYSTYWNPGHGTTSPSSYSNNGTCNTMNGVDGCNYYPIEKGYYYGQTATGDQAGMYLTKRYAVIGAYMEFESQHKPVSNIEWSYRVRNDGGGYALGTPCIDQGMYAAVGGSYPALGIGLFAGYADGTSYANGSAFSYSHPENIQDPSLIQQAYNTLTTVPQGTSFGSSGIYPYTEGDYIMVVTP